MKYVEPMRRPDIPVIARRPHDEIVAAFVRGEGGEIYLAGQHSTFGPTLFFPVLPNGTVSGNGFGEITMFIAEKVDIVSPKDLGISKIVWAK